MQLQKTLLAMFVLAAMGAAVGGKTASADQYDANHSVDAMVTHGVAAGDVTSNSAVIWSRANTESTMHVLVAGKNGKWAMHKRVRVTAADDFTGKLMLTGLSADTEYHYRVWFGDEEAYSGKKRRSVSGHFKTAPESHMTRAVSFAWGGDLAGQNTCRDSKEGFPIFKAINKEPLDFFIGLGDMIYADGTCEATGRYGNAQVAGEFIQAANMENYWAHWKYNRADEDYRHLLASMPYYAIWDDHEVVNDFGPLHDTRDTAPYTPGEKLLPKGLNAFLDYNPLAENSETPKRLYRSINWGKYMEMFILDTRQYRDANFEADNAEHPKTMLGREQVVWLKEALKKSNATWKVIVSSVPMSIPTGSAGPRGRDGWANYQEEGGFEYELTDILRFMRTNGMRNVVFLTTDVHFAEVFRYAPFADAPEFEVHEFVAGPINAGVFPNPAFDSSLNAERLFFFGADSASEVTSWEQAKTWFNYGVIHIDENGDLTASIKDINGDELYAIRLQAK